MEDESKKKRGDTKDHPLGQWFTNFSEADELLQLAAARQQVSSNEMLRFWMQNMVLIAVYIMSNVAVPTCFGYRHLIWHFH